MSAASIHQTRAAIDETLRARGGVYGNYSCKEVSWDDVSRGTVSTELSCWGANITDTYLKAKDGTPLFTVRPDNWNERLGCVFAQDVAILVGNCDDESKTAPHPPPLRNVTLRDFLNDPRKCGAAYSGLPENTNLSAGAQDDTVSIRFQTVFLPVPDQEQASMQFATEAYNYNTTSDEHPRNLVILCTTQGIAVQADGKGQKRLLHHAREHAGGPVCKFWLEAERSRHQVGSAQAESEAEKSDALRRGKAIADIVGLRAMGTRFNVLMTVQIPMVAPRHRIEAPLVSYSFHSAPVFAKNALCVSTLPAPTTATFGDGAGMSFGTPHNYFTSPVSASRMNHAAKGAANAARVSRGSMAEHFQRLQLAKVERAAGEHVTVTVVMYNTVAGGVLKEADLIAAIDDMENLYKACSKEGRLSDAAFDFMKKPLAVDDIRSIAQKLHSQPPGSAPEPAVNQDAQNKGNGSGITQAERDSLEDVLASLRDNPSEATITKTRLVALGALRNLCDATASTVIAEVDKLELLRKEYGTASNAFKSQLVMADLVIRGAVSRNYV